jgi:uncharacterized cupin superfamily protein
MTLRAIVGALGLVVLGTESFGIREAPHAAAPSRNVVLDAAELVTPKFPLPIELVIGPPAGVHAADSVTWVDVAFNWRRGEFLVVFGQDEPGEDPSVHMRRFRADGQPIGATMPIAVGGGWNWRPKVAYNLHVDRYLVVWEQTTGASEWISTIRGLVLDSTGAPIGAEFPLNDGVGSRGIEPDVAARNFRQSLLPGETAWMVTWREWVDGGNTIEVQVEGVDSTGAELGEVQLNDLDIVNWPAPQAPSDVVAEAAIAFSPHTDRFLVVWNRLSEIRGRTITAAGALGTDFAVSEGAGVPMLPAVAYDMGSQRFLATWSDGDAINGDVMTAASLPVELGDFQVTADGVYSSITAEPGGFVVMFSRDLAADLDVLHSYVSPSGQVWDLGVGTFDATHDDYLTALATGQQGFSLAAWRASLIGGDDLLMRSVLFGRFSHFVHGRSGNYGGTLDSDLFLFRQNVSQWRIRTSAGDTIVNHGRPGDIPVLMDIDADDRADIGVWRPSDGTFRIIVTATNTLVTVPWGQAGDIPAPGDYSGDGVDDYAVFRQMSGTWLIRDGVSGVALTVTFGQRGDVPTPADYNADGRTDLGVWRPATGTWWMRDVGGAFSTSVVFGAPGDIPLQGNFVGSLHADQVFFRPSTGRWHRRDGATGVQTIVPWGASGDLPMPLDYDADGLLDLTVFRPTIGQWRIRDANGVWSTVVNFGVSGDLPAGAQ